MIVLLTSIIIFKHEDIYKPIDERLLPKGYSTENRRRNYKHYCFARNGRPKI